jgi:hypothetical protein
MNQSRLETSQLSKAKDRIELPNKGLAEICNA